MARTDDPNSATDQFFINVVDNQNLNPSGGKAGYAVFGKVIEGMKVVDNIRFVATGAKDDPQGQQYKDVPVEDVIILSIRRAEASEATPK